MSSSGASDAEPTMSEDVAADLESSKPLKPFAAFDEDDQMEWLFPEFREIKEDKSKADEMWDRRNKQADREPTSISQSRREGAEPHPGPESGAWERAYQQQRPPTSSAFEENMAERVSHIENVVGKISGIKWTN